MDLGITGRVAIVTAGSRGLGRGCAEALADDGAKLVLCARGEESLRDTERQLAARGADVVAVVADVADPATPARLVEVAVERFGRLDIVVANAGGPPPGSALDVDDDAIRAAVEANMLSSVRLVRSALPHLRAGGWGRAVLHLVVLGGPGDPGPGAVQRGALGPTGVGEDGGRGPGRRGLGRHAELGVPGTARHRADAATRRRQRAHG